MDVSRKMSIFAPSIMKRIALLLMMLCLAVMVQAQSKWTYGDHTYTVKGDLTAEEYNSSATGIVTFTNVPTDYEEFEALYTSSLVRLHTALLP